MAAGKATIKTTLAFWRRLGIGGRGNIIQDRGSLGNFHENKALESSSNFKLLSGTVVSKLITDRHFLWGEFLSNYRCRIVLPEQLISITETDMWKRRQKVSNYRYRFSLEFYLISTTDKDFELDTN